MIRISSKQSPSKKPRKRRLAYFLMMAVVALALSGVIVTTTSQPQWKTRFTYQYQPQEGTAVSSNGALMTQVEILRSEKFLHNVSEGLKAQGIHGWSADRIEDSLHVSHPPNTNLIHVEVQASDKRVSQQVARLLNETYGVYLKDLQSATLQKEAAIVDERLKRAKAQWTEIEKAGDALLAKVPQLSSTSLSLDPLSNEKNLVARIDAVSQKLEDLEGQIALEDTKYKRYSALLNKDEKTLMEGVILGEDPTIAKITDQLASVETDETILSVQYSPESKDNLKAKTQSLQKALNEQRQRLLTGKANQGSPIIRDSLRKHFIEELFSSKIRLQVAQKQNATLTQQRNTLLKQLDGMVHSIGDYQTWQLQKNVLKDTIATLEKRAEELSYQQKSMTLPVSLFHPIPDSPTPTKEPSQRIITFLSAFSGLFCLLAGLPLALEYRSSRIPRQSTLNLLNDLLQTHGQQVVMMIPAYPAGYQNASLHLGGLLNQFGRESIIVDTDLNQRLLSRYVADEPRVGVLEHLLTPDLKETVVDVTSGAKVLPLETTIEPERELESAKVIQRLPHVWQRWSNAVVILDIPKWNEALQQLLPHVSQVIFYTPPAHPSRSLLPKVFKSKYKVPVSLMELHPER